MPRTEQPEECRLARWAASSEEGTEQRAPSDREGAELPACHAVAKRVSSDHEEAK